MLCGRVPPAHYQPLRGVFAGVVTVVSLTVACRAAEWSAESNAGRTTSRDWTGAYVGAELGYATGSSDWSAAQTGGLATAGSFDVFHGFNAFTAGCSIAPADLP